MMFGIAEVLALVASLLDYDKSNYLIGMITKANSG